MTGDNGDHSFPGSFSAIFTMVYTIPLPRSIPTEAPIRAHRTFVTDFNNRNNSFQEHKKSLSDLLQCLPEEIPFFTQQLKGVFVFHPSLNTPLWGGSPEHPTGASARLGEFITGTHFLHQIAQPQRVNALDAQLDAARKQSPLDAHWEWEELEAVTRHCWEQSSGLLN